MAPSPEQFEDWWGRTEPGLRRVVSRLIGKRAADVVQDVAVLALRNIDRFGSIDDFARWCTVRGKWLALDELARGRRRPQVPIEAVEASLPAGEESEIPDVLPLIDRLPDRQRRVVVYKLMGYRTGEIARAMRIEESAVRSHWRFALRALSGEEKRT